MNRKLLISASIIVALVAISISAPTFLDSVFWVSVLTIMWINILLAVSLRTIMKMGYISLGHVGFSLIGAYSSALFVMRLGIPFWIAIVLAGLVSAAVALVLGYPFLKVRGVYFILLTFLTAETFRLIAWYWWSLTGGPVGLVQIPSPNPITIPGIGVINFGTPNGYYYLTVVVVCLSVFLLYRLENSHLGFKWTAIQNAEGLASSIGINVTWYKILNFAIACFFAGISGSLFAHYQHSLSPDSAARFGEAMSIYILLYMAVGGPYKFAGPIIGTFVLTMIPELARPLKEFQPMLVGAIAIIVVLLVPKGLVDLPNQLKFWYRKLLKQVERARGSM